MKTVLRILKYFFIWRLALFFPLILAGFYLGYGASYPFFEITYYKVLPQFLNHPLLTAWSNFDGVHYLNIAADGYITEGRFFPLLPLLIYIFSLGDILFPLTFITGLILPNFFFVGALIMFVKLLKFDYSEKISLKVIIYLLFFPTAFFFVSVYSEGLFLFLTLTTFYFARKKYWLLASLSAMFLILTRFVGIFIIPALIYEYCINNKLLKLKDYLYLGAIILISSVGLLIYSTFNYFKWGDFLYFLNAHTQLDNGRTASSLIIPLQTLYRYFKILNSLSITQFEWWIALLEVGSFIFGVLLLFVAWRKKVRVSYLIFGVLAFLLPSLSGTFSGLPRYLLIIFPIFIALSLIKSPPVKILYCAISGVMLFILLIFFSRGYFIA